MTKRRLHLICGCLLMIFLTAHLFNHLMLWSGADAHIAVMKTLRPYYRPLFIEVTIVAILGLQLVLGLRLALARGIPKGAWAWAQVASGGYLLFFFVLHVPSVFAGRLVFGLDTNIHFAAATVHSAPTSLFFVPYYTLAVTAIFTHISAALRFAIWPKPAPLLWAGPALGFAFGLWIVVRMMGLNVPAAYL